MLKQTLVPLCVSKNIQSIVFSLFNELGHALLFWLHFLSRNLPFVADEVDFVSQGGSCDAPVRLGTET